jgi:hypothetical protein
MNSLGIERWSGAGMQNTEPELSDIELAASG